MPVTPLPVRKKRWHIALGIGIGALVTTLTESVVIGKTVADLFVTIIGSLG